MASSNKIYDEIEDELLKAFEQEDCKMPLEFPIYVPREQMEALLEAGIYLNGTKLPPHISKIRFKIGERWVAITVDPINEN